MSSFFCSKRTIDNVVTAWFKGPPPASGTPDHLGRMLWKLNAEAVIWRYDLQGEEEALRMHDAAKAYTHDPSGPPDDAQMLKSLSCFLYQCNEGTFDEEPLFKQLSILERKMATVIPQFGPAYEAAVWD